MKATIVLKQIRNFKTYEDKQKTSLDAITRAYVAAKRAAVEAKRAGNPQYLMTCASLLRLKRKRFQVRTLLCGYASHVISEQVNTCLVCDRQQFDATSGAGILDARMSLCRPLCFCYRSTFCCLCNVECLVCTKVK